MGEVSYYTDLWNEMIDIVNRGVLTAELNTDRGINHGGNDEVLCFRIHSTIPFEMESARKWRVKGPLHCVFFFPFIHIQL